jgi:hypothetical protein
VVVDEVVDDGAVVEVVVDDGAVVEVEEVVDDVVLDVGAVVVVVDDVVLDVGAVVVVGVVDVVVVVPVGSSGLIGDALLNA